MPTLRPATTPTRAYVLVLALGLFAVACSDAGDEGKGRQRDPERDRPGAAAQRYPR
ncbi:MAG: hypothetical protein H6747_00635 [Deltaproteobacteria bacterium]|nr:hypothetical protein [Deltaproteobacteria bacterium]